MKRSNCVTEQSFCTFWRGVVSLGHTASPERHCLCHNSVKHQQRTGLFPGVTRQGHVFASSPLKAKSKAKCGAVLISRALIIRLEEKLPWAPTTWQWERVGTGGEGAKGSDASEEMKQLVFHLCFHIVNQKPNLHLTFFLLSRKWIKWELRRMKVFFLI